MRFNHLISIIFFCGILVWSYTPATAQKKWDKQISKIDKDYGTGNYKKADKRLKKFHKKTTKKLGANHAYLPAYYSRLARISVATGHLDEFENALNLAEKASKDQFGEGSVDHARNLLELAEILVLYKDFFRAGQYLESAEETLEAAGEVTDAVKSKLIINRAEILSGKGFYNEALKYIDENKDFIANRAVAKETRVDQASGKIISEKLSLEEIDERMNAHGNLLILKAYTLGKQGKYIESDNAFIENTRIIEKNRDLGKKSLPAIRNKLLHASLLEDNGLQGGFKGPNSHLDYNKTLKQIKKDFKPSHYLAFDIYERVLKHHLKEGNRSKYNSARAEYRKAIRKNFKNSSLHMVNLNTIEFDKKISKSKTGNLSNEVSQAIIKASALPRDHWKRVQMLEILYEATLAEEKYFEAGKNLEEILRIKKVLYGEDAPEYHLTLLEQANYFLSYTNKIEDAGKIYQNSFYQIVEPQIYSWHVDYLDIMNNLALYYIEIDDYKNADEALGKAVAAAKAKFTYDDIEYGKALDRMASLYIRMGNYKEAEERITQALDILVGYKRDKEELVYLVQALETRARLHALKGLFDDAESTLYYSQRLLNRAKNVGDFQGSSDVELAELYLALGKYSDAEEILNDVVRDYSKLYGTTSRKLVRPLVKQGQLKLVKGDYGEAEKIGQRALNISTNTYGSNSAKNAAPLLLIADINATIGDYERANDNYLRALGLQEQQFGRKHIDVAKTISQLALVKFYQDENDPEVEPLLNESRDIIEDQLGNRTPTYAEALKNLAVLYISKNRYDDAYNALSLAESIWTYRAGKRNNINTADIYVLTGDLHYKNRELKQAEENYDKALRLYDRFFNNNHPEYIKVLSRLSKVYYMNLDMRKATGSIEEVLQNYQVFISKYFPTLSEREKTKFWNTIKGDYEFYNTLAIRQLSGNPDLLGKIYNNALLTKAILLNSSLKVRDRILNSGDTELITLFNDWLEKKEFLTAALSMTMEQLAENDINPDLLTVEVERLEKTLSERSEIFSQGFEERAVQWQDVQATLKPNEVAVEMIRYRHFDHSFTDSIVYLAIYVKEGKRTQPEVVILNNGKDLEGRYFNYFRNNIIYRLEDPYSYARFWRPIEVAVGKNSTIYLSADGIYNQMNLEAIMVDDTNYVLDNSNIILVSNTRDLYKRQHRPAATNDMRRALMFGNPEFYLTSTASGMVSPLPGTAKEIDELKNLFKANGWGTDYYLEIDASEDRVKALDNPSVFHIATHGFFSSAPETNIDDNLSLNQAAAFQNPLLRTGLLLKGAGDLLDKTSYNYNMDSGILTAFEAMNLNLDRTELVVLSACETGVGELAGGEGVYGLQRAFMVAGAKTLIMSLFKVSDEATQKLMVKFYKKWLESGDKRKAFVDAKKEIRNEYDSPYFWGSFIMIGLD